VASRWQLARARAQDNQGGQRDAATRGSGANGGSYRDRSGRPTRGRLALGDLAAHLAAELVGAPPTAGAHHLAILTMACKSRGVGALVQVTIDEVSLVGRSWASR
jgi:hypothetical protein